MTSWSDIVSKGKSLKVPISSRRIPDRQQTESTQIFAIPKLANRMRVHRAEALLQLPLHNDTVLFELPAMPFEEKEEVFSLLSTQIGPTLGARIITAPPNRMNGMFMVEARFNKEDHTEKALTEGLTIDEGKYQAIVTRTENEALPKMVRVHMFGIPFEEVEELKEKIKSSMETYGTVCQINLLR
ncbi:hypothetical protein BCR42DRAFT_338924 [Absidia repens]|uniref:Uncharacterized protein n=1 Tax=Absidia repens TaxID=90262 RepID=A0A1X2HR51_9FUNG|nr:hypothetical protein BCR42DRAFT_338924 [Absidia repens]